MSVKSESQIEACFAWHPTTCIFWKDYKIWTFQVTEEGDDQQACPTLQQIEENVQNWGQVVPELEEEHLELAEEEGVGDINEEQTEDVEHVVEGSPSMS